jgi:hypothetical protein
MGEWAELLKRAMRQKLAEKHPVCVYCGLRQNVTGLASRNGQLVRPTYANRLFPWRRFVKHLRADERGPCIGSGEPLIYARGFET